MDLLTTNCCFRTKSCNLQLQTASNFLGRNRHIFASSRSSSKFSTKLCSGYRGKIKAMASQNQTKKSKKPRKMQKKDKDLLPKDQKPNEDEGQDRPSSSRVDVEDGNMMFSNETLEVQTSLSVPSRSAVLQACTVTSGLIGALGVLTRQVSHIASREGWPIVDCSADITLSFELWHLELIAGSVILVSLCRYLLLKIWPDFAESSEAANQQVLTSLEPVDYLVVAFLPGISEELLFHGALLPLFGMNMTSIFAVAALFGILHLGSGRKYSFAIWATFVGVVYGYATTLSSSIIVAMASHALNNLIGGIIWRYSSNSSKQIG
ncbi:hypothetical protein CDL12_17892 [Handroanthus impetiginosus]|uniref:CAAX prenyl protease 2/Lysostaphin resistance protein A-like domain-containing protein n=1 Tax=Handroanthus impetiginosus TaxID=429701 RepID=A0A2G9GW85_9LAMI|nr:hypothetical protein CDL12_17892 [Handroanthus impetiginosus]